MIHPDRFLGMVPRSTLRDDAGQRNIAVLLQYDGTGFLGFQRQAQTPTVQQVLEEGLERILKHPARVIAAGRTDTGVHASGQVINFRTASRLPEDRVCHALNSVLPPSIVACAAAQVVPEFHARFWAKRRVYYYLMETNEHPTVFLRPYTWHYPWTLDLQAMNQAAAYLRGTRDFRSFCVEATAQRSTVRALLRLRCRRRQGLIITVAQANAFLRGMVRALVGTLVDVGRGKLAPEDVERILAARDRAAASAAAPAQGLCLARVEY